MATEQRPIDANKLEKMVEKRRTVYSHRDDILAAIAAQPTVDAVEVVRCKDCKRYLQVGETPQYSICAKTGGLNCAKPDDFCSYGERRS